MVGRSGTSVSDDHRSRTLVCSVRVFDPAQVLPGARLGRCVVESITQAGTCMRYEGRQTSLNRRVRIELYAHTDEEGRRRFRRGVRTWARLPHPNIARVHDSGTVAGYPYVVTEFVGESVHAPRGTAMPLRWVWRFATQLLQALEHLHRHDVVHRNLNRENVLVRSGLMKLTGLVWCKATPTRGSIKPGDQEFLQNVVHITPESLTDAAPDRRSDLYGAAALLGELLTGRPLFDAGSFSDLVDAVANQPPDLDGVPDVVRSVLERALAKEPTTRFNTSGDLREALEKAVRALDPYI